MARLQQFEYEKNKIYTKLNVERAKAIRKLKSTMSTIAKESVDESTGEIAPAPESENAQTIPEIVINDASVVVPLGVELYIIACKGNVYQSCGDDELSILQYLKGWSISDEKREKEWQIVFINAIGLLAYYNVQYKMALKCFDIVASYRSQVLPLQLSFIITLIFCI